MVNSNLCRPPRLHTPGIVLEPRTLSSRWRSRPHPTEDDSNDRKVLGGQQSQMSATNGGVPT